MKFDLLDHGSVELVETWGSDERIIEAARMSTAKGFLGWGPKPCPDCGKEGEMPGLAWRDTIPGVPGHRTLGQCQRCKGEGTVPGDEKLLRYLWEHEHYTPFEMAGMTIEVSAPIFVFREWHRHRTQGFNEASARYSPMANTHYLPTVERVLTAASTTNKQAQAISAFHPTEASVTDDLAMLADMYDHMERVYQYLLARGWTKELARLATGVARYSKMRATANLRNWLAFAKLRSAPNAQYEIRVYSHAVEDLIGSAFPRTKALFDEGRAKRAA